MTGERVTRASVGADDRPFPPGEYPLVVVGSGPGALQVSYCLARLGVGHAVISADPSPAGMFRRFPFFQRLLSWTKPYGPFDHRDRAFEKSDWNSLLADEPENRALMPGFMDGTSSFPSRPQMEQGLVTFAERTGIRVRHDCRWERTRRENERFVLETSDGEYRCRIAVFAVGVAEPWKPATPGLEDVPHYADTRNAEDYAGKRLFIVGKQNSGFELASGLLQWAQQITLASPRPAEISVNTHSLVGVRARYLQPWEDAVLGGGVFMLNASLERVVREDGRYRVHLRRTDTGAAQQLTAEEVIAATGWTCPLQDLPALGVATFGQNRLPAQTPFWESASVPGIYFAGTITQGSAGLKKYGIPSNSGALHGYRYNARLLARRIAERHFGWTPQRAALAPAEASAFLLDEATNGPEFWHQRSYLARVVSADPGGGLRDDGIVPLAHFVDAAGPDALAITVETDAEGDIHPCVYLRRRGSVSEHVLGGGLLLEFRTDENRSQVASLVRDLRTS